VRVLDCRSGEYSCTEFLGYDTVFLVRGYKRVGEI